MKLVLIDGNAIIHRAFHALPPMTSKDGKLTNAIYGFFSMFIKILQDIKPDCLIVCFDMAKPNFRQALYAGYQATRPKVSDDLIPQFAEIHEILERSKIQIFEVEGYEADDLIGTLSVQGKEKDAEVVIVSGDRDLLQLVNGHVKELMPITGLSHTILYDEAKVEEKFGVTAEQIVDYKALIGDASDNYPGVMGIGPKTAVTLINKYRTLENIYNNLSEIPEKVSLKLAQDAEGAMLAKKLATIDCDAPIHLDTERCAIEQFDMGELEQCFIEYGFASLIKRLHGEERESDKKQETSDKRKVQNKPEIKKNPQLELL